MKQALLPCVLGLLLPYCGSSAATFTVTSTNDSGLGSLRQAILDANGSPGPDLIAFSLTGGLTVSPGTALPALVDPVTIDGATQPGFSNAPIVELSGASAGTGADGLRIWAGNSTVRGLIINRFNGDGIEIATHGSNVIEGCWIGLSSNGASDLGNNVHGIFVTNAPHNRIGGAAPAQRNVISGNNQNGIHLQGLAASGNSILGNLVGLNSTGGVAVANSVNGIFLNGAPGNTIGDAAGAGSGSGAGNVISGNSQSGVRIEGTNAHANLVVGNTLGLDRTGLLDRGNGQQGVLLLNAPSNRIGGSVLGERNVISGNGQAGVRLDGAGTRFNVVAGNMIGSDSGGSGALGNSSEGINVLNNASANTLGAAAAPPSGNQILFNGGDGVWIQNGTNNSVRGNQIHANAGLGIDLGPDGKAVNDAGDADSGANGLQNHPVLIAATNQPAGLFISGSLNSRPNAEYVVDFFSNVTCDPGTNGEGQIYLGSRLVATGPDSNAVFSIALGVGAQGRYITATATDTNGNTSEFAACVRAESTRAPETFSVSNTNDAGPGSLRQAIHDNNLAVRDGANLIAFAIAGPGPHIIAPTSMLPAPTEPVVIDGYSQPGASANSDPNGDNAVVRIRLDGLAAGNGADGLRLTSTGMVARGLSITRFNGDAIEISTNGLSAVEGCFLGLDADGTTVLGNSGHGVHINSTALNRIGGAAPAQRNLVSGQGQNGIQITGGGATNNFIAGNFIGTDRSGRIDLGNGADGISLNNAPLNRVGSLEPNTGNVISGNNGDGIDLNGAGTTNNVVLGNIIGADVTGLLPAGNGLNGVAFNSNARFNRVGATAGGGANRIAFNGNHGVAANSGTNNAVQANVIFGNGALGLDLGNNGVTANDAGDADAGVNQLQNFPVITQATIHPASVSVAGILDGRPNSTHVLDFYANLACDPSGFGEGAQVLGSATVTTDAAGRAAFDVSLPGAPSGRYLTATATDPRDNTSEFSACFAAASTLPPVTLTVQNTNDAGPGSLRQALLDAGNFPAGDANRIAFAIPGPGPHTIGPLTPLPAPSEPVFIDGYTQPGSSPNTLATGHNAVIRIRLDGGANTSFGADGLRFRAGGSTVRGLAFVRWTSSDALEISQAGSNRVAGCYFGIDLDGSDKRNSQGVLIASAGNEVGGLTPADRNVFAYTFGDGIRIAGPLASNNVVRGNYLGTDFTGTLRRGNLIAGVTIADATNNLIGGLEPGARNLISGNQTGVSISGQSGGNQVIGNYIGTDATGAADLGNVSGGVNVSGGSDHVIGGALLAARNVIAGNDNVGISVFNASRVRILGNWIGLSATGQPLSNSAAGVQISGDSNRLGGTLSGEGNVIAGNADSGVIIANGRGNAVRGNSIYDNRARFAFRPGLGLDLGEDGITANDAGDGDGGPNERQNHPVLTNAFSSGSATTVQGSIDSAANGLYQLDFFASLVCDASGHGEGQQYLGSAEVATDGSGHGAFEAVLGVAAQGRFITATATDGQGNTSEFSLCQEAILANPPATYMVTTTNDSGPGSLRQAILDSNAHVSSQNNTIGFNLPGAGVRAIRLASALPAFVQPVTIDGFTQPGAGANTQVTGNNSVHLVELNGGASGSSGPIPIGLNLNIAGLVVRGLRVVAFSRYGLNLITSNCVVAGNLIYSNGFGGVRLDSAPHNLIGGTDPAARNVIAANQGGYGIEVTGPEALGNRVLGNFLGTDLAGVAPWGSQFTGLALAGGSGNVIGGTNAGAGNVIAFHTSSGVAVPVGTNQSVRGNRIFSNAALGIDLDSSGVAPNDPGDLDAGANHLQNHPILTNATAAVGTTVIRGRLNSRPNRGYGLDFFASSDCDFDGHGEGQFYLGSADVITDSAGDARFEVSLPITAPRSILTATATDPAGNTSEFSPCLAATVDLPGQMFVVTNTNDSGPGSLRQAILDSSATPSSTPDRIVFNVPGGAVQIIAPVTPLPVPTDAVDIDGFTQPGSVPNSATNGHNATHRIQLDGSGVGGRGLVLTNGGNVVRGLSITRFAAAALDLNGPGGNRIEGCRLGVSPDGAPAGNGSGLSISSPGNRIGGTHPAALNVIAANEDYGIVVSGLAASNNVVIGNRIGLDGPTHRLGHGREGIWIAGQRNRVGGSVVEGNVIAFNERNGVRIDSGLGHVVQGNRFVANREKPIAVSPGANGGVKAPVLTAALRGSTRLQGSYQGSPNTQYELEAWAHYDLGPPVNGVTQDAVEVVGRFTVTTDALGNAPYDVTFPQSLPKRASVDVNATCAEKGSSEFSPTLLLFPAGSVDLQMRLSGPFFSSPGSVSLTGVLANIGPTPANNSTVRIFAPPSTTLLGVTSGGQVAINGNLASVSGLNLAPGSSTPIVISGAFPGGTGTWPITVRADSPFAEFNPDNNIASWELYFGPPGATDVEVEIISSEVPDPDFSDTLYSASSGRPATVTVRLSNRGPAIASQVQASLVLGPASGIVGRQFNQLSAAVGSTANQGTAASWFVASLAPGESVDLEVTMTWHGESSYDQRWSSRPPTLQVNATLAQRDLDPFNNSDSAAFIVHRAIQTELRPPPQNELSLTWSAATASGALDFAPSLVPPVPWQGVPPGQIVREGDRFRFSVPLGMSTATQQFFRLPPLAESLPAIDVSQLWLNMGGIDAPQSDWGRLNLRYLPTAEFAYMNLSYNDRWVVQNVPLVPGGGTGVVQEVSVSFPLGLFRMPITNGSFGFSLTSTQSPAMPPSSVSLPVLPEAAVLASGELENRLAYFPASPLIGGPALTVAKNEPVFPNREQGVNECAVVGMANSLEYLNARYSLGMDPAQISADRLKEAVGWTSIGAPIGADPSSPTWANRKDVHVLSQGLPVTTEITSDLARAQQALNDSCNIEIRVTGHVACLRAMIWMGGTRYMLMISHDLQQGDPGGTVLEPIFFDSATGDISGSIWTHERKLTAFVIECASP